MNLQRYSKGIIAACGGISAALTDGVFDLNDGITVVVLVLTAIGVYAVPNRPADTSYTQPPLTRDWK